MRVDASAQAAATQAVARAAQTTGADFDLLLATARRESGLNASAHAATSSAAGLFQFVDATWMSVVQRYGAKHGLNVDVADPGQRQSILNLRYNPDVAAAMAGELTHENAAVMANKLGRPASAGELYAAHVLGPSSAAKLIHAAESGAADATTLAPRAAAANRALFYQPDGAPRTPAAVLAKLDMAQAIPAPEAVPAAVATTPIVDAAPPLLRLKSDGSDLWALALRAYRFIERG